MTNANSLKDRIVALLAGGSSAEEIANLLLSEQAPASTAKPAKQPLYMGRPTSDNWANQIDSGLTIEQAAIQAGLLLKDGSPAWEVQAAQAFAEITLAGGEKLSLPSSNVLYRTDNGIKLGEASDSYAFFQNQQGIELAKAICGEEAIVDTCSELLGGKKVFISLWSPEEFKILGDEFKQRFLLSWGHDGSTPLNGGFNMIRVICCNTLAAAIRGLAQNPFKSIRHSLNMEQQIRAALAIWRNRLEVAKAAQQDAEKLAKIKFSQPKWEGLVEKLFPLEEGAAKRTVTAVQEQRSAFWACLNQEDLANHVRTGWGFVQGAADFADHTRPIRLTENWEDKRTLATISGSPIVAQARELVLAKN